MHEIRTSIDIEASPRDVWDVLMDFEGYHEWNPFILSIEGSPTVDRKIDVVLGIEGKKPMNITPTVTECSAPSRFAWKGSVGFKGVFDGHHQFELVPFEGGTRLVHYEEFSGALSSLVLRWIRESTTRGFEEMNRALKGRIESGDDPS
jgi:hypothetical protein